MSDKTAILIDKHDVTAKLIRNPWDWRVRVVEEVTVDAASTCLRRRSLQVAPLREHLEPYLDDEDPEKPFTHALVALPVAPIPVGPLMDFDVSGPEGDGTLLPRVEIAALQALYLESLAASCEVPLPDGVRALLTAVLGFNGEGVPVGEGILFEMYIEQRLGRSVSVATLADWNAIGDACRNILRPRLDVFRGYSPAENPALALPDLFRQNLLFGDRRATETLRQYLAWLKALAAKSETSEPHTDVAGELLTALADYANYYELVIAMRVPLDESFLVKISERRDLELSRFMNNGNQELVVADARTNHVTFKVTDPNVVISKVKLLKAGSEDLIFQSHSNEQTRTFYNHAHDRQYRARLSFRLGLLRRLQLVPFFIAGLIVLLGWALWDARNAYVGGNESSANGQSPVLESSADGLSPVLDLRTLALIVGPAAIAASVLLAREPSTLGSRLRRWSSGILGVALLSLVALSFGLYVKYIR